MPRPLHEISLEAEAPRLRFHEKYVPEALTGCWLWAAHTVNGYGRFWDGEHGVYAHRYSYVLHHGPIPLSVVVDHKCRNPSCVNPDHLRAVTQQENLMAGATTHARKNAEKSCCPQCGGAYHRRNYDGYRSCRRCIARRARERRSK